MADPVASRSGFLSTYMGNHPDTLVAYVRHFGAVTSQVVSASMISIDSKGMTLSYVVKGTSEKKQVTVRFDPPLSGYDEVKPRLLSMKLDAEESLGMIKRPQINTFEFPPDALMTILPMVLLTYVTFSVPSPDSYLNDIGPWIRAMVGGPSTLRYIWIFLCTVHSLEALYAVFLCNRHRTGLGIGMKWTVSSLLFGFPVLLKMRRLVQKARIDSITKID